MPNLFRILAAVWTLSSTAATANGRRVWGQIRWHQRMTVVALAVTILLPVMMYIVGLILGIAGWVHGARFVLAAGAATAALLSTLLWVRFFAYGYLLKLFSEVLSLVPGANQAGQSGNTADLIPRDKLDAFLVWLRSWTAWYAIAGILLAILPIWNNVVVSMLLFAALLGASAVITGKWSDGPWARRIAMLLNTSVLAFAIAVLVNQRIVDAAWNYQETLTNRYSQRLEREEQVEQQRQTAQKGRNGRDARMLKRFRKLQAQLEERAVDGCTGYSQEDRDAGHPFCSVADKRAHASFARDIERLEKGTYWNSRSKRSSNGSKRSSSASSTPAAPTPAKATGTASPTSRLAPPPSLPGGAAPAKRSSSRRRSSGGGGGAGGPGPVPNVSGMDWDYILAPLPARRR